MAIPKEAGLQLDAEIRGIGHRSDLAKELAWILTRPCPKLPTFMQKLVRKMTKYTVVELLDRAMVEEVFQSKLATWLYNGKMEEAILSQSKSA